MPGELALFRSPVLLLALASVCEIAGGYLVWQWIRADRPWWFGAFGFVLLAAYGLVPTLQPTTFGRTYAAYGGFFIVVSLLWGWRFDGTPPDRYDWLGLALCVLGTATILFYPRR